MRARKARPRDYSEIEALLQRHRMTADPSLINHRDVALVAFDGDRIIGFLWVGLMAKNQMGYIDKFVVSSEYAGKGVGHELAQAALKECVKRGVREVHGFIREDASHYACGFNALKMAMASDGLPYTYVRGQLDFIVSELTSIKESA